MSTELTSPLASIIKKAAAQPVAEETVAKLKRRFANCSDEVVVLLDNSGSMLDFIGGAKMRKCDHLRIAVEDVLKAYPKVRLFTFDSSVREIGSVKAIREPMGGTDLAGALDAAAGLKPRKTIIVSDGLPDDQHAAELAADLVTGSIDTIYCGPDAHPAAQFLAKLARAAGGVSFSWDGFKPLGDRIRGLLGPA
jgi:Mg-chelatase subunit ChlD